MEKFVRAASINRQAAYGAASLINIAEDNYDAYIDEAAAMVLSYPKKPLVLLSGPSGSGKTTAALRLERRLLQCGVKAHTISMDNYFLTITPENEHELPRDENGNIDLESPLRLDIPLFSEHMKKLAAGEEFLMPRFDFSTQSRPKCVPVRRKRGEVMIIEGIHALNPAVTGDADEYSIKLYVSVQTGIQLPDGSLFTPRSLRLMRRICRDSRFRKRDYRSIFAMYKSVCRGEELYINPFKSRADAEIDSFMAYEASVYKGYIEKSLTAHADDERLYEFESYAHITRIFKEICKIDGRLVPADSAVREFIGGSELEY